MIYLNLCLLLYMTEFCVLCAQGGIIFKPTHLSTGLLITTQSCLIVPLIVLPFAAVLVVAMDFDPTKPLSEFVDIYSLPRLQFAFRVLLFY